MVISKLKEIIYEERKLVLPKGGSSIHDVHHGKDVGKCKDKGEKGYVKFSRKRGRHLWTAPKETEHLSDAKFNIILQKFSKVSKSIAI